MLNIDPKEFLSNFESQIALEGHYCLIDVDRIDPNPAQPRINCSNEALDELMLSIQENGLLQPIIVQKTADRYQIIAGERRWRAHIMMKEKKIAAIVRTVDDQSRAVYALAENIAREDLSDYEISKAIRSIEDEYPNKTKLADAIGIKRPDMYRYLAFFSLPEFILNDLNRDPTLLSRAAAAEIKKILGDHPNSSSVVPALEAAWDLLKEGTLHQTHVARHVKNALKDVNELNQSNDEKIIRNKSGSPIGQVKQTNKHWTVQLDVAGVNQQQQQQIVDFIQQLLHEPSESVAS